MTITRNKSTQINIYSTEAAMQAAATGDLNRLYTLHTGVYKDFREPNAIYDIDIFQDDSSNLFGLFRRK